MIRIQTPPPLIFLSGGGNAQQSKTFDKIFLEMVMPGKILYIPVAMNRDTVGYEACYDWIVSTLSSLSKEFVDIIMITDLTNVPGDFLNNFKAIYLGGGNTYKLLNEVNKNNFDKSIIKFFNRGGIIYGGSAGAVILGKDISIVSEEKDREISSEGLNLVRDFSIRCHYSSKDDLLINNFVLNTKIPVIAIPEGEGLILGNSVSNSKIVGRKLKIFKLEKRNKVIESPFSLKEFFRIPYFDSFSKKCHCPDFGPSQ